ncbi:MAG TPA: hypothetical protein VL943_10735 [Niabella sp.]|nr:hypothetical protein [Niabella sp.]
MSYSIPVLIISVVLSATSCQQKSTALSNGDLTISISTVCGWCTGGDSLVINAGKSVYQCSPSCDPAQEKEYAVVTDKKQWNELVSLLNQEEFKKININLCNVCADGCDVRVTVKNKNFIHSISYGGSSNEAVATVRPFLEKLEAISAAYKKEYKK